MPQLKQPASLESTVLYSIKRYILNLGQLQLGKVCSGTSTTTLPTRWGVPAYLVQQDLPEKHVICDKLVELQPFLHPGLPLHLSNAVTSVVLEAIATIISKAKCTHDNFTKSGDDSCRAIAESLISVALHDRVSHVDLLQWPRFMGEVLLKHLDRFQHLQVLKLLPGSWSPIWENVVEMLESGSCSLNSLVSFSMRCHCTDKILQVVAYSTGLKFLDVMSSVEVTDKCVSSMFLLKNLKIMNMCSTSLTADGYIRLLAGLPHLSKLVWFDSNGQALRRIETSPLRLQSYDASRVSYDQLNIMVHMCPYLTQVSLHWIQADLSMLGALKCLAEIKLAQCSAIHSNLRGLLQAIGQNIVSLELHEVRDVDLLMIGIFCINIKRMNLGCEFLSAEVSLVGINSFLFRELEELRFGSEYCECLFFNCVNIKKLEVSKCHNLNDQVVTTLLVKNPLKQLQILSIGHCGHLSLNTVHLLLTTCDNLRVLEGLDSWGGVTKSQVTELCKEMERKNLNVEIQWKKPLHISW